MFGLARHSIAVNGMDAGPVESYMKKDEAEEFEPYDRKLHDRMKALHAELEFETLKVSELRREAPARAAKIYEAGLIKEFESDERILAEIAKKIEVDAKAGDLGIKPLERKKDTEAEYARSAEILKGLQTVSFIYWQRALVECVLTGASRLYQQLPINSPVRRTRWITFNPNSNQVGIFLRDFYY